LITSDVTVVSQEESVWECQAPQICAFALAFLAATSIGKPG
jgi:hypothetical protein